MNWKLTFYLSLIGIAMAVLTVSVIPSMVEPVIWLAIFFFYAWVITSRVAKGKYFLHAFFVSVLNGVWIGLIHAALHDTYVQNHVDEVRQFGDAGPVGMMWMGPLFGAAFGIISGFIAMLVGKIRKPKAQEAAA